jgi:hypothetical protein
LRCARKDRQQRQRSKHRNDFHGFTFLQKIVSYFKELAWPSLYHRLIPSCPLS